MKCPYCDHENRAEAEFCEMCEMPLLPGKRGTADAKLSTVHISRTEQPPHITPPSRAERLPRIIPPENMNPFATACCPNCASPLQYCEPIVKTTINSSGGGYGFFSGCCGMIFLGPLGLLCGLRKQNITSSNQTWWVCRKCGKEFIEKEAAKEIANSTISSSAITTGIITLIWEFVFGIVGYNGWTKIIFLLMIAGTWMIIPERIKESTGYTMQQLLVREERMEFYKKCAFYGILCIFAGAALGGKIMEYLLS